MKKSILAIGMLASGLATANPIVIDAGTNLTGVNTVDQQATVSTIGIQINNASSQYFDVNGTGGFVDVGDVFYDVGTVNTVSVDSPGSNYGVTWKLNAEYALYGTVVQENPGDPLLGFITGGYLNLYYQDMTDANGCSAAADTAGFCMFDPSSANEQQTLSISVTGSTGPLNTSVGININGVADYGFDSSPSQFVQDFFNVEDAMTVNGTQSTNLFELATAGLSSLPMEFVDLLSVTTLNGAGSNLQAIETLSYQPSSGGAPVIESVPTLSYTPLQQSIFDQFAAEVTGGGNLNGSYATVSRSGEELSGNISIVDVPEPGTLAFFGLSLLGLSLGRKKLSAK